jgi:hypothetical protein
MSNENQTGGQGFPAADVLLQLSIFTGIASLFELVSHSFQRNWHDDRQRLLVF